jgi:hypothetical protein
VAIGVAGLSIIERYLVVAALGVLVFAAVAVGGWTLLEPGTLLRRAWAALAGAGVLFVIVLTALHLDLRHFDNELRFRGDAHVALSRILKSEPVRRGLRCGPLTTPNHKLVPDSRWLSGLPFERVWARAEPGRRPQRTGVRLLVVGRFAIFQQAWTNDLDPASIELPPPAGWRPVARTADYAAYARC